MNEVRKAINERDLFNYIFFKDFMSVEKREFLEDKENKYEQIKFYKDLKENLDTIVTNNVKQKLENKISVYKNIKEVIKLYPINVTPERKLQEMPIFAAASATKEPEVIAESFINEDKTFVVRMIKMDNKTKIYPFNLKDNSPQKIKLIFHPTEETFTVDSDKHLELDIAGKIESVSVQEVK